MSIDTDGSFGVSESSLPRRWLVMVATVLLVGAVAVLGFVGSKSAFAVGETRVVEIPQPDGSIKYETYNGDYLVSIDTVDFDTTTGEEIVTSYDKETDTTTRVVTDIAGNEIQRVEHSQLTGEYYSYREHANGGSTEIERKDGIEKRTETDVNGEVSDFVEVDGRVYTGEDLDPVPDMPDVAMWEYQEALAAVNSGVYTDADMALVRRVLGLPTPLPPRSGGGDGSTAGGAVPIIDTGQGNAGGGGNGAGPGDHVITQNNGGQTSGADDGESDTTDGDTTTEQDDYVTSASAG